MGSIIDQCWILTCGHCVAVENTTKQAIPADEIFIFAGGSRMTKHGSPDSGVEIIQAETVHLHPQYLHDHRTGQSENDIALVKLSKPLTYTERRMPINIPWSFNWTAANWMFEIAGWGKLGGNKPNSENLMMYEAQMQPVDDCQDGRAGEICYDGVNAGSGPCGGGSGAAIAVHYKKTWWQLGVHKAGRLGCNYTGMKHAYGVNASAYCDFFLQTIGRKICPPHKKLVGGTVASIETYPHAVALREIYNGSWVHICGGSIIAPDIEKYAFSVALRLKNGRYWQHLAMGSIMNEHWILTAGHSVSNENATREPLSPGLFWIFAGAEHLTPIGTPDTDVAIIQVASIHLHPDFYRHPDGRGCENDIALLKIHVPHRFPAWHHPNLTLEIAGWGRLGRNKPPSQDLRMYYAIGRPIQTCIPTYPLTSPAICISGKRNVGPCEGDSGAAVATQYHGRWLQLGVYTRGRFDCDYSVHTTAFGVDATQNCAFYEQTIGTPACITLGVALRRKNGSNWKHACMGSIMNKEWILTAGHCVSNKYAPREALSPKTFWIFAGAEHMTSDGSPDDDVAIIRLGNIHLHPDFYRDVATKTLDNDIALLKLSTKLSYSTRRLPIQIPANFPAWRNKNLTLEITGWGKLGIDQPPSVDLRMYKARVRKIRTYNPEDTWTIGYSGPQDVGPCREIPGSAVATQYHGRWLQLGVHTRGETLCDYSSRTHAFGVNVTENCAFYEQTIGKPVCITL
ncbi:unnamed protein product, partial [Mesorhabditis spiculigera]